MQIFSRGGPRGITWFRSERSDGKDIQVTFGTEETSAIRILSTLHGLSFGPEDERMMDFTKSLGATNALKRVVQFLQLDGRKLRRSSMSNSDDGTRLVEDGSNLPRVLAKLKSAPKQWEQWLEHVRMALPGLEDVRIVHREDDRHDYLMVRRAGVEVPPWGVSEGTLRLFALTVIPYLRKFPIAYLLEEPENGIYPMAIEFAYQSLSTVYGAQVFIASHSPTLLRCVEPKQVLCFGHESEKGTVIVRGDEHPRLRQWLGSVDDAVFWAADILTLRTCGYLWPMPTSRRLCALCWTNGGQPSGYGKSVTRSSSICAMIQAAVVRPRPQRAASSMTTSMLWWCSTRTGVGTRRRNGNRSGTPWKQICAKTVGRRGRRR